MNLASGRRKGVGSWIGFGVATVPYAWIASRTWFVCDDAYIAGAYARRLSAGQGWSLFPGEPPIEGFSSPAWVILGAAFELLGLRAPEAWAWVGLLAGFGVLLCVRQVLVGQVRVSPAAAHAAVAVLASTPAFSAWATGGLETMTWTLALCATAAWAGHARAPRDGVGLGLGCAALILLRPEGVAWAVALLSLDAGLRRPEDRRHLGAAVGVTAACAAALLAWRWGTFGAAWPHTAVVKAPRGLWALARGAAYVLGVSLTVGWVFCVPWVGRGLGDRRGARVAPWAVLAAGCVAFAVVVGGDYLPWGRFLVPAWPMLAIVLGWRFHLLGKRLPGRVVAWVAVCVTLAGAGLARVPLAPPSWLFRLQQVVGTRADAWRPDAVALKKEAYKSPRRLAWARALDRVLPAGTRMVVRGVGSVAYETDLHVLDAYGLVTAGVAERAAPRWIAPGHDARVDGAFFLEDPPDVLFAFALDGSRAHAVIEALPHQWGLFEDLGGGEAIYVADLVAVPDPEPLMPAHLLLIRRLREGEVLAGMREAFKDDLRAAGYRPPKLEPLDARRLEVAREKRRGGWREASDEPP